MRLPPGTESLTVTQEPSDCCPGPHCTVERTHNPESTLDTEDGGGERKKVIPPLGNIHQPHIEQDMKRQETEHSPESELPSEQPLIHCPDPSQPPPV